MKLKVDENLSVEVAAALKRAGHDAETVFEEQLGGGLTATLPRCANEKAAH